MLLGVPRWMKQLKDLQDRLAVTVWADLPAVQAWSYGVPEEYLRSLVKDWNRWLAATERQPPVGAHEFHEARGQRIHMVRVAGSGTVPLVLLHGWPTSYLAFHRVLDPLVSEASELILVSLPGFGGSVPLSRSEWTVRDTVLALVEVLGNQAIGQFVIHGEDWGSQVAREMALIVPDWLLGVHVSAGLNGFLPGLQDDLATVSPTETQRLHALAAFAAQGGAYLQLQSHRPDSLAFALADSPVGTLAWMIDKFQLWRPDDTLSDFGLGRDFILANATLYWLTTTAGSSMRIYAQNAAHEHPKRNSVPTVVSVFGAADYAIRAVAEKHNNIVGWFEHHEGGHIAPLDAPDVFVSDLRAVFRYIQEGK